MAQLYGYLFFDGTCREAMEFYQTCLGGKLDIMTVGQSPVASQLPPEALTKVMHAALSTEKCMLMASDMVNGETLKRGNDVSMCWVCESKEEIETLYAKLGEGGMVNMPLKEEFFGTFGSITDKFGVRWMFQFGGNMQM